METGSHKMCTPDRAPKTVATSSTPQQAVRLSGGGRENLYAPRMESRPLPSLPNQSSGETPSLSADKGKQIQVDVSNEQCPYHIRMAPGTPKPPPPKVAPKPALGALMRAKSEAAQSSIPPVAAPPTPAAQLYTVLDVNDMMIDTPTLQPCPVAQPLPLPPPPPPCTATPTEDCAPVMEDEPGNISCQEIALRPTRDGSQQKINSSTTNSSWP